MPGIFEQAIDALCHGISFVFSTGFAYGTSLALLNKGIDLSKEKRLLLEEAKCLALRGRIIFEFYSNFRDAIVDHRQSIILFCHMNDPERLANALLSLAFVETHRNRYEDARQALANCHDLQPHLSPQACILYNIRLALVYQHQGLPLVALQVLKSLLERSEVSLFVHMRRMILRQMGSVYLAQGQLSRALRALNMAVHLVPDDDYQFRADLASNLAQICTLQSRLGDALLSLQHAQHCLQSIHYQGYSRTYLHTHIGRYALACGDLDGAKVELNIVLRDNPNFCHAHRTRVKLARIELCHQSPATCLSLNSKC